MTRWDYITRYLRISSCSRPLGGPDWLLSMHNRLTVDNKLPTSLTYLHH